MNALEQEYEDNLRRTREREARRGTIGVWAAAAVMMSANGVLLAIDGPTPRVLLSAMSTFGVLALVVLVPAIAQLDKWRKNRTVESASTERERLYRAPASAPPASAAPTTHKIAIVVGVAGAVVAGLSTSLARSTPLALDGAIYATVLAACGLGFGIKRVAERRRAKRNAKLQLEMERWLASADSCKVGAREWTK